MRIWDLPVELLCNRHLLAEHRELHAIWTYLHTTKGGSYRKHPETLRWKRHEGALACRHYEQAEEMKKRGMKHKTPLGIKNLADWDEELFIQPEKLISLTEQVELLQNKKCNCFKK